MFFQINFISLSNFPRLIIKLFDAIERKVRAFPYDKSANFRARFTAIFSDPMSDEWRQPWTFREVVERIAIVQASRWTARSIQDMLCAVASRSRDAQSARWESERERERPRENVWNAKSRTRNTQSHASGRATRYERLNACRINDVALCASRNVRATRGSLVPFCFSWQLFRRSVSVSFFFFFQFFTEEKNPSFWRNLNVSLLQTYRAVSC